MGGGSEVLHVPVDMLRPLSGGQDDDSSFRPCHLPSDLVAKVVETVCVWTFLPIKTELPGDEEDDDATHGDEEEEAEEEKEEGQGREEKEKEEDEEDEGPPSHGVLDLLLLLRCLQCYGLRCLDTLLREEAVAHTLLHLSPGAHHRPTLLKDLLQLAVRRRTDLRGISDVPVYEEGLMLLLLRRHTHHLPAQKPLPPPPEPPVATNPPANGKHVML